MWWKGYDLIELLFHTKINCFGYNLWYLVDHYKIKFKDLVRRSKVPGIKIMYHMYGKETIDLQTATKIAKAIHSDLNPEYLMGLSEDKGMRSNWVERRIHQMISKIDDVWSGSTPADDEETTVNHNE